MPAQSTSDGFGKALRTWRRHRGLSQLALSLEAGVSPRHVSFLETGRSSPSQDMVMRLLETLEVPLWDRNRVLLTAGYAPAYSESSLDDETLAQVRWVVRWLLDRHDPYPAYAIDGAWNVIESNRPYRAFLETLSGDPAETRNVLCQLCAPHLLRPRVTNWAEVMKAVLRRVRRQLDAPTPPPALAAIVAEIVVYPDVAQLLRAAQPQEPYRPLIPIEIRSGGNTLRWITTLITIGAALDIAVDELVVECFLPADTETKRLVLELADDPRSPPLLSPPTA